jgi:hypothetical protein
MPLQTPAPCHGKEAIAFLQTIKNGESIRLRTKVKNLEEEFVYATAQRNEGAWDLWVDGVENTELINDEDEKDSVMSTDNWDMGWYSFVPSLQLPDNSTEKVPSPSSSSDNSTFGNSDFILQWEDYKFWGDQTDMSCDNQQKFRLFPRVSLNGELMLQPKQPVSGENSLCGVFYFVAVPVCGDELEDKAKNFKCIVFNADSKEMQFVPFLTLHLSPQSTKKQSDSCNINWDTAHKTAHSFFLNPVYKEYAFKNVTEEECKVLKVIDPHTEQ